MFDFLLGPVIAIQDFYVLFGRALRNLFRPPHYTDDIALQMDTIGVGSLFIVVILTGFFSGAVMALQMARVLAQWGQTSRVGQAVSITLVRELGPVLTALMVAGRNSSGIASELGSMKVTEQIDAMRALGTDPHPETGNAARDRHLHCAAAADDHRRFFGHGGRVDGQYPAARPAQPRPYWRSVWPSLEWNDLTQGLLKPFMFAFVISLMGCYYGLRATGGTQGVGKATTQAVVWASVLIFVLTFFLTRIFTSQLVSQ